MFGSTEIYHIGNRAFGIAFLIYTTITIKLVVIHRKNRTALSSSHCIGIPDESGAGGGLPKMWDLGRRRQTPLVLQMALHGFENEAVYNVADGNDQNHDSDDSAHIVQVPSHHQYLAQA